MGRKNRTMSTPAVVAAIAAVEKIYADFEAKFALLQTDVSTLSYPQVEDRLRELQGVLNPANAQFNIIGGTGKREDVEAVNRLGMEFNNKNSKMRQLGEKAHASQPVTRTGIRNAMKEDT